MYAAADGNPGEVPPTDEERKLVERARMGISAGLLTFVDYALGDLAARA